MYNIKYTVFQSLCISVSFTAFHMQSTKRVIQAVYTLEVLSDVHTRVTFYITSPAQSDKNAQCNAKRHGDTGVNVNRLVLLTSSSPSTTITRANSDNTTQQRAVSVRLVSRWGQDFLSTCTINSITRVNKITPKTNKLNNGMGTSVCRSSSCESTLYHSTQKPAAKNSKHASLIMRLICGHKPHYCHSGYYNYQQYHYNHHLRQVNLLKPSGNFTYHQV
jgi:hypothetical protein